MTAFRTSVSVSVRPADSRKAGKWLRSATRRPSAQPWDRGRRPHRAPHSPAGPQRPAAPPGTDGRGQPSGTRTRHPRGSGQRPPKAPRPAALDSRPGRPGAAGTTRLALAEVRAADRCRRDRTSRTTVRQTRSAGQPGPVSPVVGRLPPSSYLVIGSVGGVAGLFSVGQAGDIARRLQPAMAHNAPRTPPIGQPR